MELRRQLAWPTGLPHCQSHQTHWALPRSREPLFLPSGSQLFSGMFLLDMECIGIVLLSTGFYCLSSRGYLFQGRPVIPSQIQAFIIWRHSASSLFSAPRPPSSLEGFCSTPPDGKCYLCLYTRVMRTFWFGPIRFCLHVSPEQLL